MTTEDVAEVRGGFWTSAKVKLVGLAASGMALVASASAATIDINGTVGPILDSVAELIPTLVNLIIAILPAIIVVSIIAFVVGFLDQILVMLKIR